MKSYRELFELYMAHPPPAELAPQDIRVLGRLMLSEQLSRNERRALSLRYGEVYENERLARFVLVCGLLAFIFIVVTVKLIRFYS